jgi:hypothetical protein
MSETRTLYHEDFVAWSQQQAEALRSTAQGGTNQALDWKNLAEEIESLGRSERRELGSRVRTIIEHLLKLEYSTATEPRSGWRSSVRSTRVEIEDILETSPSLKNGLDSAVAAELKRAIRLVVSNFEEYGEENRAVLARLRAATYTTDEILGDWFPPEPPKP